MLLLLFPILAFAQPNSIEKESAHNYIGSSVTICDYVHHVSYPNEVDAPYIIYFEPYMGRFSDKKYLFTSIIWKESVSALEVNPVLDLIGETICVSGVVSVFNRTPQIVLRQSGQISFIKSKHIGVR